MLLKINVILRRSVYLHLFLQLFMDWTQVDVVHISSQQMKQLSVVNAADWPWICPESRWNTAEWRFHLWRRSRYWATCRTVGRHWRLLHTQAQQRLSRHSVVTDLHWTGSFVQSFIHQRRTTRSKMYQLSLCLSLTVKHFTEAQLIQVASRLQGDCALYGEVAYQIFSALEYQDNERSRLNGFSPSAGCLWELQ